jgi:hypothetical protein
MNMPVSNQMPPAQPPVQSRVPPPEVPPLPDQVVPPTANQNLIAAQLPSQTQNRPVDQVRALMRSTNPFTDYVSTDDLKQVKQTFERLPAADANTTFSQLSDQEIRNITGEMRAPGIGDRGGLSANDRRDVIANMSQKLDAKNFERFAAAYGNPLEIASVLNTPGSKATTDAKIGFMNAFDEKASGTQRQTQWPVTQSKAGNDEALAIGMVLTGMRGDQAGLQRALGTGGVLDRTELGHVLTAGLGETTGLNRDGSKQVVSYNPALYSAISDTAKLSNSPDVKANVFQASADVLGRLQESANALGAPTETKQIASFVGDKMSTLLRSDPNGIVRSLEGQNDTGKGMSEWTEQMLRDRRTADIGSVVRSLRNGPNGPNNKPGDPNVFLSDKRNANALGFMLGATHAGLGNIKENAKAQAELVGQIAGFAALRFDKVADPVKDAAEIAATNTAKNIAGQLDNGTLEAPEALYQWAMNGLTNDKTSPIRNDVRTGFNTVITRVNSGRD